MAIWFGEGFQHAFEDLCFSGHEDDSHRKLYIRYIRYGTRAMPCRRVHHEFKLQRSAQLHRISHGK